MGVIKDKRQMYMMLRAGSFGHTLPSVEDMAGAVEMVAAGGSWAVRSKVAGGPCAFGLSSDAALAMAASLPEGSWNLSPMLSDPARRCYAHLYDSPTGLKLHYSEDRKACRLVAAQDGCTQKWLDGSLAVRGYMRSIMDQTGYDTIDELLREYPGHVIEFTVMSSRIHAFGPTNLIIWEIRPDSGSYEGGLWGGKKEVDWDEVDANRESMRETMRILDERRAREESCRTRFG